jgi:4-hydroxy-2,2'-bipyrrole-5-carbaldehyde O-methyltransferase
MTIAVNARPAARRPGKNTARYVRGALTLAKVSAQAQMRLVAKLSRRLVLPAYRAAFLEAAADTGMLRLLSAEPRDAGALAAQLGISDERKLRLWLDFGVRLGQLAQRDGRYRLKSRTARALGEPRYEAAGAALQEMMRHGMPAVLDGPQMLRTGQRFSLASTDATAAAPTSRLGQSLMERAVAEELRRKEPVRLLDLGCGIGLSVRYPAELNPRLSVLAIELDDGVAQVAARNIRDWKLSDRVEVRQGDLRSLDLEPVFDLITMHNNIYYFADAERAEMLRRVRSFLAPGGKLLICTTCKSRNFTAAAVNLWLELADFGASLPQHERLTEQLREAGFAHATSYRVVPGAEYRAFVAVNARPAARRPGANAARFVRGAATLAKLAAQPELRMVGKLSRRLVIPAYRMAFLKAAADTGMLRLLSAEPRAAGPLAAQLGIEDEHKLRVWLDFGVRLGQLARRDGRYRLKSRAARAMAQPRYEGLVAGLEEVMRYNVPAILDGLRVLRAGQQFSMPDDITRLVQATLLVQPHVERAVAEELDRKEPVRLLELGCGIGLYVRYAAQLNPRLSALAIELDDGVVKVAARNFRDWKLSDRVELRQADLRTLDLEPAFDLITLHNNINVFPDADRTELLRRVRSMLVPGGKLLVTTLCKGCKVTVEAVNLFMEYCDLGGSLPQHERLVAQLREAGFAHATSYRVFPGEEFRAFVAVNA